MRTLYLECKMGAAGDMLTAALLELIPDRQIFVDKINSIGLSNVHIEALSAVKMGITGTQMSVKINGEEEKSEDVSVHHHSNEHTSEHHHHEHSHEHSHEHYHHEHHHSHTSMHDIEHIISALDVSEKVKLDALSVYRLIAEAESAAHGRAVEEIHFHEVGTMDAVADIVGVCILMEMLSAEKVIASPVHLGNGFVKCMHGVLPVPAPATAHILKGIPAYSGNIEGELCTPTGAALLRHFAGEFGDMPPMQVSKVGYGLGKKDFPVLNCVRSFIGETEDKSESVVELVCNIDDMTGEALGFAQEMLLKAGACDVFTQAVQMKKSRPAVMLTCICKEKQRDEMLNLIFRHTSTIGVREHYCKRYTLNRRIDAIHSSLGDVRVKVSEGYGVKRCKAEYDDISRIAEEKGIPFDEAKKIIEKEL